MAIVNERRPKDPNIGKSIKRTIVPIIVGALVSLAAQAGIDIPEGALAQVIAPVVASVYYSVLRSIEGRWGWAGTLLGGKGGPSYQPKETR